MKKTVLLILMVSSLFADKVVYQVERQTFLNKEIEGEYLDVLDGKTYIRMNNEKLKAINCSDVIVVIDDDGKPIQFDCSESTFIPKTLTELDVKEIKKFYFGGILIAAGGFFTCLVTVRFAKEVGATREDLSWFLCLLCLVRRKIRRWFLL